MNSKRTKDLKNNDRVRFAPVDGDKIRGELYVTHNNRKYIIKRSFGATKKEDISEILDAESGEILTEIPKDEPGRYFLNVNSSTFYKTLFINQLGVAISKDKEEEIIDKAANLLNSDDTNIPIQKSIERLENIKKSISTVRKTGELDILRNRLNDLNQEKYEGYKLSEENIHKENALISLREKRNNLRTEIKNLDIYKKYLKKSKLQKEYEEITQYLKKREELKKKERYIEESISSRNGIIDEVLLNDIKDENSLYFSLLDMKNEEEKIDFNDETVIAYVNMIRQIIQSEVSTYLKNQNIETFEDLKVSVSDDGLHATLKDTTTKEVYENIPNYTNIKIKPNDFVRMYISNQGLKKYIGQTFGSRSEYLCQTEKDGDK